MNLILLGGNSPQNEQWLEQIAESLSPYFKETYIQTYGHWESGGQMLMGREEEKLEAQAEDLDNYIVFAKSAGVVLTLDAIQGHRINPNACIFVGSPIGSSAAERFDNYRIPTLFIQQTKDPIRSYKKVHNILENSHIKNYELVEVPGNDHLYGDIEALTETILTFLQKEEMAV